MPRRRQFDIDGTRQALVILRHHEIVMAVAQRHLRRSGRLLPQALQPRRTGFHLASVRAQADAREHTPRMRRCNAQQQRHTLLTMRRQIGATAPHAVANQGDLQHPPHGKPLRYARQAAGHSHRCWYRPAQDSGSQRHTRPARSGGATTTRHRDYSHNHAQAPARDAWPQVGQRPSTSARTAESAGTGEERRVFGDNHHRRPENSELRRGRLMGNCCQIGCGNDAGAHAKQDADCRKDRLFRWQGKKTRLVARP